MTTTTSRHGETLDPLREASHPFVQVEPDAHKMSSGEVTEADTSYRQLIDHVKGRISSIFGAGAIAQDSGDVDVHAHRAAAGGTGGSGGSGGGDPWMPRVNPAPSVE